MTLELSMAETVIVQVALRALCEKEMSQKDRELAELIDRKLRLDYKGEKIRLILCGE